MIQRTGACGIYLASEEAFAKGQLICTITDYTISSEPTYQTIQVGVHQHIQNFGVLAYLNHSCHPNVIMDTVSLAVYAAQDISEGDELTFFYPSTEWDMARPFVCLCGAPECIRLVVGARFLSVDMLSRYYINPHIRTMMTAALQQATNSTLPMIPAFHQQAPSHEAAAFERLYS
jgi:hypothetical protein